MPQVSVIIPTKNRREMLRECLASVRAQTFTDWEALVCDDGSTDGTEAMVREMITEDPRIRFVACDPSRLGAPARRNDGLRASRAEFIVFLDDDDLLASDCLRGRLERLLAEPHLAFVAAMSRAFREAPYDLAMYWNVFTDEPDLARFIRCDAPWQTQGPLWRRSALLAIGPWDEMAPRWQDWEFHIRALCSGLPYARLRHVDCFWRVSRTDTISNSWRDTQASCDILDVADRLRRRLRRQGADESLDIQISAYMASVLYRSIVRGSLQSSMSITKHARNMRYTSPMTAVLAGGAKRLLTCPGCAGLGLRALGRLFKNRHIVAGANTRNCEEASSEDVHRQKAC